MAILTSVLRAVRPLVSNRTFRGINPAATRAVRNSRGVRIGNQPLTNPNAGRFLNNEGNVRRGLGTGDRSFYDYVQSDPNLAARITFDTPEKLAAAQMVRPAPGVASVPRRAMYSANQTARRVWENPLGKVAVTTAGLVAPDYLLMNMMYGSGEPQAMPQQFNPQDSVYTLSSNPGQLYAPRPDEKQMQYEYERQMRNQYYAGLYQQAIAQDMQNAGMTIEQAQALQAQMANMYSGYSSALGGGMYE